FIASQRRSAELSLRQLAARAGVSNPYLSQIERGLRKPSAEVLQQLAKALRVSAETLYVRAGILDEEDHPEVTVEAAVRADLVLTERQKRVLIDVYHSFVRENGGDPENPKPTPRSRAARNRAGGTKAGSAPTAEDAAAGTIDQNETKEQ